MSLLISEIFGPTYQGEGPSAGQLAAFLRLSRCNLTCTWCDTPETWDTSRYDLTAITRRMTDAQVVHEVLAIPAPLVVITGGEPMLQMDRLVWLADMFRANRRRVEIETNGTIVPSNGLLNAVRQWNVSPKLANSGLPYRKRINSEALRRFNSSGRAAFKFVVEHPAELEEVAKLETEYRLAPIWVMPQATTSVGVLARMREIADETLARRWNLSSRLHILLEGTDVR
ncbi:7-carboxy-7-deazaguanine synthase QueE [Spongiactinospora sp. TRM90649]|uniref:7-carboxy-7-deazaguanine synthase QueE n=1 Tax=Spongiactinospora sp. TRM90649 TaxID=3031114 RepID=UPI0023F6DBB9|nr:7-carboxy-7-deazaguanine synthase QueE [Spongiactinospora sp. TRM90649]MDF5759031.1 7-carboxy-7-deazaguanine synthase QueE [Spongiactinospora sp. TRM90649]